MEDQLVAFTTAQLAKEKGFTLKVHDSYLLTGKHKSNVLGNLYNHNGGEIDYKRISAPTQSLLQKWLREVHNIHILIKQYYGERYYILIEDMLHPHRFNYEQGHILTEFKTYEEALEVGLIKALELI